MVEMMVEQLAGYSVLHWVDLLASTMVAKSDNSLVDWRAEK